MQLDAACDDDGRANSRLTDQGSLTGANSALDGEGQENTENEARTAACEMEECGDASALWRAVKSDSASAKQRRLRFGSSQPRLNR